MQFFATAALIAVASAAAIESRTSSPCGGLTSSPQCCAASVDGILDLDCSAPAGPFDSASSFTSTCAKVGKEPGCCLLGLAGLALVCNPPAGV